MKFLHAENTHFKGEDSLYWLTSCFLKIGPFPATFFIIFVFSIQLIVHINFADDWIWTADLRCWKWPLYQLRHNHFPTSCLTGLDLTKQVNLFLIQNKQSRSSKHVKHEVGRAVCSFCRNMFSKKYFCFPNKQDKWLKINSLATLINQKIGKVSTVLSKEEILATKFLSSVLSAGPVKTFLTTTHLITSVTRCLDNFSIFGH